MLNPAHTRGAHRSLKNIEALIADGGEITLGALPSHECVAPAANDNSCPALLVRRDGESLNALLLRLDKAIAMAWADNVFIDEFNKERSPLL